MALVLYLITALAVLWLAHRFITPFTLLAALLPTAISFTYSASIFFFLAGLSLFLFARDLGCRESAAAFGAAGWMYASALSFFILWPHSGTWGVMPLVFLGTRRV